MNRVTKLFNCKYPIIQAGMVWCSGHKLATAVSNAGGLGIIGAGSMRADTLSEHIQKFRKNSKASFAVNIPLLYKHVPDLIEVVIKEKVPIVFTSAGNPNTYTSLLKENGIIVCHVVSSTKFAKKSEESGVDAVVAEGFEAGGHNGRDETTTLCLVPAVVDAVKIPVLAAGGVSDGRSMLAAFSLGAEAVQIGSRFAASYESSAHDNFKHAITHLEEGGTELSLKQLNPVRLIKNSFYHQIKNAEAAGASAEVLKELLGKGRSKKGIFEGDMDEGELEIGQVAASFKSIQGAREILESIWNEFLAEKQKLCKQAYETI